MPDHQKQVLWWGRFDPDYSRNRVLRQSLTSLGWNVVDFFPYSSKLGGVEAKLRRLPKPDLVWVPCFRQRDIAAARYWSNLHQIPLVVDPLISAWDKQVFERSKFLPESAKSEKLRRWESRLLASADLVLADTPAHADFFTSRLEVSKNKIHIVYVGAEQPLFSCAPLSQSLAENPLEVLFFGSFIRLQGTTAIIEAARLCANVNIHWRLIGNGPERAHCEQLACGLPNVTFEDWIPYSELPQRIHQAHIVLGIFGTTAKAGRVIPNKAFQALACGRPLITRTAEAYPADLLTQNNSGIIWVPAGDPAALAKTVIELSRHRELLPVLAAQSRTSFNHWFSTSHILDQLKNALDTLKIK